jgi:hypothetical protein
MRRVVWAGVACIGVILVAGGQSLPAHISGCVHLWE